MDTKKDTRDRRAYLKEYYAKNKEKAKEYCVKNREKRLADVKQWRADNKEKRAKYSEVYNKEYYKANKEKVNEQKKQYNAKNKEKIREYRAKNNDHIKKVSRERYAKNRGREILKTTKRKAIKMQAMPKWLTLEHLTEIEVLYTEAIELRWLNENQELHIDHIIPLSNPNVCGLHVPWNLQILSGSLNCKKSNKFDGTYDNKGWKDDL
jgi:hypothetical protein